jgi:ABC-2 type transport system permease protein
MYNLIRSEFRKLVTTRTIYLFAIAIVIVAAVTVADPNHDPGTFAKPFNELPFVFFTTLLTRLLILVMGIRVITDEVRYGTHVPTFLSAPSRTKVVAAKAIVVGAAGLIMAVLAEIAMVGAAMVVAKSDGASLVIGADGVRSLVGLALGGVLWAIIGLGLGAIIRNQLIATVGGLVWLMAIEDVVRGQMGEWGGYLPGQAGLALGVAPSGRGLAIAGITLTVYAVAAMFAGASLVERRDVA